METIYDSKVSTRILNEDYQGLLLLCQHEGVRRGAMIRRLLRKAIHEAVKELPQK